MVAFFCHTTIFGATTNTGTSTINTECQQNYNNAVALLSCEYMLYNYKSLFSVHTVLTANICLLPD